MSDCSPHDADFKVKKPGEDYGFTMTGQVHVAGIMKNQVQSCKRCGRVLLDYSKFKAPSNAKANLKGIDVDALVTEREVQLSNGNLYRTVTVGAAKGAVPCGGKS